jgi:hypothetical protein
MLVITIYRCQIYLLLMTEFAFDPVEIKRMFARADYQAFNVQDNTLPAFDLFSANEVFHGEFARWFVSG